jgi:CheY-like chemotaxis protein
MAMSEKSSNEILVIHDDPAIRNMFEFYFSKMLPEHPMLVFETKEETLLFLEIRLPSLIIIKSTEMRDQYDSVDSIVKLLSERERTKHIPFFILLKSRFNRFSPNVLPELSYPSYDGIMNEPFDIEEMLLQIKEKLASARKR